jgi:hypothetical protein
VRGLVEGLLGERGDGERMEGGEGKREERAEGYEHEELRDIFGNFAAIFLFQETVKFGVGFYYVGDAFGGVKAGYLDEVFACVNY